MTGADALVQILKAEGIRHAFCFPTTPVLEAMARADLRVLLARQERVAGNMADGVSRSTNGNQIGTWTVQQSAGAENAFAAISHSFTDSTPVLFIPGHPGVSKANIPPTFDAVPNYAATTRHAATVQSTAEIPQRARMAFTALRAGRPGPVMLEMPVDVCGAEFSGPLNYEPIRPAPDHPAAIHRMP